MTINRREFLAAAGAAATVAALPKFPAEAGIAGIEPPFRISLAQWSVHKTIFAKKLDPLDFPRFAKEKCGIDAVEYVNQFFMDKATNKDFLAELNKRCSDLGVKQLLIMCDSEGYLGDPNSSKRSKAVENHHKWVDAARTLGCHSIRVNAYSEGSREEQHKLAVDGLSRLVEYAAKADINVIVENHGKLSSDGKWLTGVMKAVNHPRCGTLPDFGNFYEYDRYLGVEEMMPFAKGVSAKSYDFDEAGNETRIDYPRMMAIVLKAGYHGHVGIEYEGNRLPELEGILATKKLLERIREEVSRKS